MTVEPPARSRADGRLIVQRVAVCVLALGVAVLAGWSLDVTVLKSVLPGLVPMQPNTGVCFLLAGLALALRVQPGVPGWVVVIPTVALLVLAAVTLAEDFFGFGAGVDEFLFEFEGVAPLTDPRKPGRMAPASALAFCALAGSLLLAARSFRAAQLLATVTLGLGLLGVLGHLYGVETLYVVASKTGMALHTGFGLALAGVGALFVRSSEGIPAALLDPGDAGEQLRRLVPAAVLTPVALGALALAGRRLELFGPGFEAAVVAIGTVAVLMGVAYFSYASMSQLEAQRLNALGSLAASEDRYRRTFQNATIGLAHLAPDGRWLHVNERMCEILGYEEEELLTKTYAEVSHLEDLELDVKQWELLRRGEIADYGLERRFRTKEGEIVHADVRFVREEDESGDLLHFIAVVQDVTGRKISEGTLRVYERALASTQNGIVITDATHEDHPIAFVNAAFLEISGYQSSEVIGKNCRLLNARARDQEALAEVRRAIKKGEECSVLLRNHRKDGTAFWNQLSIAPVRDPQGKLTHFVGILIDVTTQVEAATERDALLTSAEAANRAKDRFLSVVSHELRSPLNAVLAWTSILREEPDTLERGVEAIEASVRSQTHLVDDLLDASRIRTGTLTVDPTRIELVRVVRETVEQEAPVALARNVALELTAPSHEILAMLDLERLGQIVRNLIDNALKFTPDGGRIDVTVDSIDGASTIEVRDTGRGIAAEDLPHVFDEFWQEERKGASGGKGLGLGLPIVKHLIERQGGTITAESEGRDCGATFRITFPVLATGRDRDGAKAPLAGVEVVVVDDDKPIVDALTAQLEKLGAIPRGAGSVAEALRFFEKGQPEILISDIGLPVRDGLDLIRAVRALDEPMRSVLSIAVTGLAARAERRRIQRAGFDAYLSKPVEPAVVIDRVRRLRARAMAPTPPSRKVLLIHQDPAAGESLAQRLQALGHAVRSVDDSGAALQQASEFEPDFVLAFHPLPGVSTEAFAGRLSAQGLQATLVGVFAGEGAEGDQTDEQSPFDFVLREPLDEAALQRILRFGAD